LTPMRLPPLSPGDSGPFPFIVKTGEASGAITGTISDICTGAPIEGATVQLLVDPGQADGACTNPAQGGCVTVASTQTDQSGEYPGFNSKGVPIGSFGSIPILPSKDRYAIEVSAPGYDTLYTQGNATAASKHSGNCGVSGGPAENCDFSLTFGQVTGGVSLTALPPPGQTVSVQVFAEDSGTSTLVAMLPAPIIFTSVTPQTQSFTMNVPSIATATGGLDFYAQASDLYQGAATPNTGHTIVVQQGFTAPPTLSPSLSTCPNPTPTTLPAFEAMDCVGHGSVAGTFATSNNLTSAVLMKNRVQLMTSPAGPEATVTQGTTAPSYAICAPGDTYQVQAYQVTNPLGAPSSTPTPEPIGSPTTVIVPMAAPTSSGCPTTCTTAGSSCPGICAGTIQSLP
jgi:hypothetical protein